LTVDCDACTGVARGGGGGLTGGETEATCGIDDFSFFGILAGDPPAGFRFFLSRSGVILNGPAAEAVFGLSFAFD
jgi:hypothetical protein